MSLHDDQQFFSLYQKYRYKHQLDFYESRYREFNAAKTESLTINIAIFFISALASGVAYAVDLPWLKLTCLLIAAISPILSTALAGYSALYSFEQQAKLYQDTIRSLRKIGTLEANLRRGLNDTDFAKALDHYVHETEEIFSSEQGQWGQLAQDMRPPE